MEYQYSGNGRFDSLINWVSIGKDVIDSLKLLDDSISIRNSDVDFSISDNNNYDIVKFNNGHIITKNFDSSNINTETTIKDLLDPSEEICDINHVIGYGQSLMAGSYSGNPISTSNIYNNLIKFSGGVRPYDMFGLYSNRHTYISRTSENAQYGEMFKTASTSLSEYDNDCINRAFEKFVGLTETTAKYIQNSDPINNHYYDYSIDGTVNHVHINGETILTGFCEMLDKLYSKKYNSNNFGFYLLASCAAYGSASFKSLLPLDKGGTVHVNIPEEGDGSNMNYFENLMLQVTKAKELADSENKTYSVKYVIYFEEGCDVDYSPNLVAYRILQLFNLINSRIKEITHQLNDIKFYIHCSNTPTNNLNLAQYILSTKSSLELNEEEEKRIINKEVEPYDIKNVFGSYSIQGYEPAHDNIHRNSLGQKLIGETLGYLVFNNKNVLYATKAKVVNNDIYVYYEVPVSPIIITDSAYEGVEKIDSENIEGNIKGFLIRNSDEEIQDIISSISVVNGNTIKISCNSSPTGYTLEYAHTRYSYGNTNWRVGNIKDSQGENISAFINNNNYPLDNWSYSFKFNL